MTFLALLKLENFKTIGIVLLIVVGVWFYKDYNYQKSENKRQTENVSQLRKLDSFKYATQTYSQKEIDEFLRYQRQDLQVFLQENKINTRRIERIITQQLKYRDTIRREQDLSPILEAIRNNQNVKVPVVDSTDCLIIKGFVAFKDDTLSLNITDRKFTNTSDVVSYWERNQWKFLGIPTRVFGRKKATVIIKDNCGNTKTVVIDKRQK